VVVHKAIGIADPPKALDEVGEKLDEVATVLVSPENLLTGIAPGGDVVEGTGVLNTERTGHGERISWIRGKCYNERPDPICFFIEGTGVFDTERTGHGERISWMRGKCYNERPDPMCLFVIK
jgi:hypothetical protein